jgi:hypothetical protein
VHGIVTLFLEVIALAIIHLLIGLVALVVFVIVMRMIVSLIILMAIVRSLVIAIGLVTLMIIVLLAKMLPVAQIMAVHDGWWAIFFFFGCFLSLGIFSRMPVALSAAWHCSKKGNKPKRVHGHCFVCLCKLKVMCLWLHKEDLFALLLRHGQLHHSTDVATTVKVAEKLYLTPHELMHWYEGGLLSSAKPANQLVANIGERQLPQGNPWCTRQSLSLYGLLWWGIAWQQCLSIQ